MFDRVRSEVLVGPDRPDLIRREMLADLLEATAARVPDNIALVSGTTEVSYAQLNAKAARAASHFMEAMRHSQPIVGLWLPRGIDLLVIQAAIAKSGAAWLPLDVNTPVARIRACLEDAQAVGIVTSEGLAPQLADMGRPVWVAEALMGEHAQVSARRRLGTDPEQPAYVIYTSGSTGAPKGIVVSQASICHLLRSENEVLGIREADRVYHGFSVAFDMSFEEIWISYLVGATVWIAPPEVTGNPEVLPGALRDNGITVLHTVPTLLALFTEDVPTLRLINVGGEMCPEALVKRWARHGRVLFNSYGPTEATVTASIAELMPEDPVTIGRPLPNYAILIVDPADDQPLHLLPWGQPGELCISGPGVAAGYLDRPKLTADKFLPNPWAWDSRFTRMYRTGDRGFIDPRGRVHLLGRADDQVKIRGFRVELGEIESALGDLPGILAAAVLLRRQADVDQLVAFVTPDVSAEVSPVALRARLSAVLPPYMVPSQFEMVAALPRLASGKIDRQALATRELVAADALEYSDAPRNRNEQVLFAAIAELFPGQPIFREADFFADLGGHSLFAARLASALRADPGFAHVSVGDIYQNRTLIRIADAIGAGNAGAAESRPGTSAAPPSWMKRWTCGAAQALATPFLIGLHMTQWLAPFFVYHLYTGDADDSITFAIAISAATYLAVIVLAFLITIAGKWLVLGRGRAGRYPLWGLVYYRWWLADRLIDAAPSYLLAGSSLYNVYLRALGANIGRDVVMGSVTMRVPDLVSIGDHASLGNAVHIENARVERGELILGPVNLATDACIGSYAVLEGGTAVESFGHLDGLSALVEGERVPANRIWAGSPAKETGVFDPTSRPARQPVSTLRLGFEASFFVIGALLIATVFFLPVFPTFALIDRMDQSELMPSLPETSIWLQLAKYFMVSLPPSAALILLTALIAAAIRWAVLPRLKPGSWPVHSALYCKKWLVNQIQEASLYALHGVYATVYAPYWYRLLGAKVGKRCEISTALGVIPDMLILGDECFVADAVLLGDEQIDGGWMTMQPTIVSRRSFIGNGAYVPDGTVIPENVLIGVQTRAPANTRMKPGDTWLGSPPTYLPAREMVGGFPVELTFRPSTARRLSRSFIEAFRIVAPQAMVIAVGYTTVFNVMPAVIAERWDEVLIRLTLAGLLYGLGTFVFVVGLKWILIGRYTQRSAPMWTLFVWLSEAVTSLYEGVAVPNFLRYLRGTPWLPLAFNILGSRIGRGVYLDTTDITEFDCVTIGEYSELNASVTPQTHLFEDRVMKVDHVIIGSRVTVGPRTTVLYSASVGDDVRLGSLTLVMKGETIPPRTAWRGTPAASERA